MKLWLKKTPTNQTQNPSAMESAGCVLTHSNDTVGFFSTESVNCVLIFFKQKPLFCANVLVCCFPAHCLAFTVALSAKICFSQFQNPKQSTFK